MHYYNEFDKNAVAALTALRDEGLIPWGDIDERSIEDVLPSDLKGYTQCHFFAGIGGFPLALKMAGVPETEELWTGSCPCQPFSQAGSGKGFADERHLWPVWFHLIEQCRPSRIIGEQVASKAVNPWIDLVFSDLEGLDYSCGAVAFPAASVGAKHGRQRTYWGANANSVRNKQPREESRSGSIGRVGRVIEPFPWHEPWQSALSRFRNVDDGLPRCVGATDAARNAIVPQQAAEFILALMEE